MNNAPDVFTAGGVFYLAILLSALFVSATMYISTLIQERKQ